MEITQISQLDDSFYNLELNGITSTDIGNRWRNTIKKSKSSKSHNNFQSIVIILVFTSILTGVIIYNNLLDPILLYQNAQSKSLQISVANESLGTSEYRQCLNALIESSQKNNTLLKDDCLTNNNESLYTAISSSKVLIKYDECINRIVHNNTMNEKIEDVSTITYDSCMTMLDEKIKSESRIITVEQCESNYKDYFNLEVSSGNYVKHDACKDKLTELVRETVENNYILHDECMSNVSDKISQAISQNSLISMHECESRLAEAIIKSESNNAPENFLDVAPNDDIISKDECEVKLLEITNAFNMTVMDKLNSVMLKINEFENSQESTKDNLSKIMSGISDVKLRMETIISQSDSVLIRHRDAVSSHNTISNRLVITEENTKNIEWENQNLIVDMANLKGHLQNLLTRQPILSDLVELATQLDSQTKHIELKLNDNINQISTTVSAYLATINDLLNDNQLLKHMYQEQNIIDIIQENVKEIMNKNLDDLTLNIKESILSSDKDTVIELYNSLSSYKLSVSSAKLDSKFNEEFVTPVESNTNGHMYTPYDFSYNSKIIFSKTSATYLPIHQYDVLINYVKKVLQLNSLIDYFPSYKSTIQELPEVLLKSYFNFVYGILGLDVGVGRHDDILSNDMTLGSCWPLEVLLHIHTNIISH